jgi:hypothetical protein
MKKINVGIIGRNFGYKVIYNAIKKDKSFNVLGFCFKNKILKNSLPQDVKIYQNWITSGFIGCVFNFFCRSG